MVQLVVERLPSARSPEVRISRRQLTAATGPSGTVPIEDSFVINVSAARAKTLLARRNPRFPSFAAKNKFIRELQGETQVEFEIGTAVSGEVAGGFGRERVKSKGTKARQQSEAEVRIQSRRQKLKARTAPSVPRVEMVKEAARERELFKEPGVVRGTQITTLRQPPPIRDLVSEATITPIQRDTSGIPIAPVSGPSFQETQPRQPSIDITIPRTSPFTELPIEAIPIGEPRFQETIFRDPFIKPQIAFKPVSVVSPVRQPEPGLFGGIGEEGFIKEKQKKVVRKFRKAESEGDKFRAGLLGLSAGSLELSSSLVESLTKPKEAFIMARESAAELLTEPRKVIRREKERLEVSPVGETFRSAPLIGATLLGGRSIKKGAKKPKVVLEDIRIGEGRVTRFPSGASEQQAVVIARGFFDEKPFKATVETQKDIGRALGREDLISLRETKGEITFPKDTFLFKTRGKGKVKGALFEEEFVTRVGRVTKKGKVKKPRTLVGELSVEAETLAEVIISDQPISRTTISRIKEFEGGQQRAVAAGLEVERITVLEGLAEKGFPGEPVTFGKISGIGKSRSVLGREKLPTAFKLSKRVKAKRLGQEPLTLFESKRGRGRISRAKPRRVTPDDFPSLQPTSQILKKPSKVKQPTTSFLAEAELEISRSLRTTGRRKLSSTLTGVGTITGARRVQAGALFSKQDLATSTSLAGARISTPITRREPFIRQTQIPISDQSFKTSQFFITEQKKAVPLLDFDTPFLTGSAPPKAGPAIPPFFPVPKVPSLLFPTGKKGKKLKLKGKKVKGFKPGLKALAFDIRSEFTSKELEKRLKEQKGFGERPLPKKKKLKFSKQAKRFIPRKKPSKVVSDKRIAKLRLIF